MTKHYLLTKDDVVNDLTSAETKKPLSANQGKILADRTSAVETKTADATTSSKGIVQVGMTLSLQSPTRLAVMQLARTLTTKEIIPPIF